MKKSNQAQLTLSNATPIGWDGAIAFTKARIKELQRALEGMKAAKERGDLWPGVESR